MEERRVPSFPELVFKEFICILAITSLFIIISIFFDAPLEDMARPSETPNPAKAPWYFVGLQELLVYFDPWLAGVVIPMLAAIALLMLPYIGMDHRAPVNAASRPYGFGIAAFGLGLVIWFALILVGEYLRGPNWSFYWPWEPRYPARIQAPRLWSLPSPYGLLALCGYYALGAILPPLIKKDLLQRMGLWRFGIFIFLTLSLAGVVIKILLRLIFHIKYVLETPWINI